MGLYDESKKTEKTDGKVTERLIKFYKDRMRIVYSMKNENYSDDDLNSIVSYLFDNKNKNLSDDEEELADTLGIVYHNEIYSFVQTCLENNNFSPQAISKFINEHSCMFANSYFEKDGVIDIGHKKYKIENDIAFAEGEFVMNFLLFCIDISQDENYCNPKKELTIDYILALAQNIPDNKSRAKFKALAFGYFLIETHDKTQSTLNEISQDVQKLFSDEMSSTPSYWPHPVCKLINELTAFMMGDKIKSNSEIQLFLYRFIKHICVIYAEGSKDNFTDKTDRDEIRNKYIYYDWFFKVYTFDPK